MNFDKLILKVPENPYTEISKEQELILNDISKISDDELLFYCEELNQSFKDANVASLLNKHVNSVKLSVKHRKVLENFYRIIYSELCWRDDGVLLHHRRG